MWYHALLKKALGKNYSVSELLSEAQDLADPKDLQILKWVSLELNGYEDDVSDEDDVSQLPGYRKITASHETCFRPYRETVTAEVRLPIKEIENLVERTEDSSIAIELDRIPRPGLPGTFARTAYRSELKKILGAVEKRLIDELSNRISEEVSQNLPQKMPEADEDLPTRKKKGVFRRVHGFFAESPVGKVIGKMISWVFLLFVAWLIKTYIFPAIF